MTDGEYKVGISFNPSGSYLVDALKAIAASFIDECVAIRDGADAHPEQKRLAALAITAAEEAAMWAVKAATKQPK